MNRIDQRFADLKTEDRAALVTFLMAGDPDRDMCAQALDSLPEAGVDLIEIGMPFTDPMADGPVIQAAALRALAAGTDMNMTLDLVRQFRVKDQAMPIVLMGYFNPIYAYGAARFAADASLAGVDGLIIVDLPPEEDAELYNPLQQHGIHLIRLVTPVTTPERLAVLLQRAHGFLYYVSITGVTGTASATQHDVARHINAIRAQTSLPIAVGFGIRTPEDAKTKSELADAVVVGSALVETLARQGVPALIEEIRGFAGALRSPT